jgi:hypothetical protein
MVASFLKPMDGLCAALYTQLHLFAVPSVPSFLLLQASLPPAVAIASLPFLRLFRDTEDSESACTAPPAPAVALPGLRTDFGLTPPPPCSGAQCHCAHL